VVECSSTTKNGKFERIWPKKFRKKSKTFKKGIDKRGWMWYNTRAAEKTAEITMKNPESLGVRQSF
jgi:hypothetical protein